MLNVAITPSLRLPVIISSTSVKSGNILVYGAEKEYTSLSTEAAKVATKNGGITIGVAGGKSKKVFGKFRPTVLINSGLEIGGGREFTLVNSCDVIIAISGGSGTLTEMAIAYQANRPIVVVDCFGGWAKKLSNKYIDDTMPWVLAKDESKKDRLATVLYNIVESIRIATVYLGCYLPDTADSIFNQINTELRDFDSVNNFGGYVSGTKVNDAVVLFKRIDKE